MKQTYSAWVNTENGNRKWHLSKRLFPSLPPLLIAYRPKAAYYTQRTEDRLGTIDGIPALRDIVVPPGYFLSNADIRSNKPVDTEPYNTQRTYNPVHQTPNQTPSPDSHLLAQLPQYSMASSVS